MIKTKRIELLRHDLKIYKYTLMFHNKVPIKDITKINICILNLDCLVKVLI